MDRKQTIQNLLKRLDKLQAERLPLPDYIDRQLADEQSATVTRAESSPTANALRRIGEDLNKIQRSPAVKNLFKLRRKDLYERDEKFDALSQSFAEKLDTLAAELKSSDEKGTTTDASLKGLLERFEAASREYETGKLEQEGKAQFLVGETSRIESYVKSIEDGANQALLDNAVEINQIATVASEALKTAAGATRAAQSVLGVIQGVETDLMSKLARLGGNGNMNRNIAVAGNQSVLSMFTDINLKPGAGVTITYAPNLATNFTDITIAATGGGGGITRQINNVSTPTVMDGTPGIDQVYLVSGTTTVTLPTAVGNENLYTVKNVGLGTVTVNTTGAETVDNDATVIMPVRYTSVDLISDGSNWNIT